jgi:hypothetical protein
MRYALLIYSHADETASDHEGERAEERFTAILAELRARGVLADHQRLPSARSARVGQRYSAGAGKRQRPLTAEPRRGPASSVTAGRDPSAELSERAANRGQS